MANPDRGGLSKMSPDPKPKEGPVVQVVRYKTNRTRENFRGDEVKSPSSLPVDPAISPDVVTPDGLKNEFDEIKEKFANPPETGDPSWRA